MARIKGAMMTRKRRKKTLKLAKGYFGAKSKAVPHREGSGHEVRPVCLHRPPPEEARFSSPVDHAHFRRCQAQRHELLPP